MLERAVVNARPLVALALLDRVDLLPALFGEVWIPSAVYREVVDAGAGRVGAAELAQPAWRARVMAAPQPDPLLVSELDAGEAEVISLARRFHPCVTLIDERRGRRIARDVYALNVLGTAGLLVRARRRGLIDAVRPALLRLSGEGYFVAEAVIESACAAAGEQRIAP